jgi:hypothetical protein
MYYIQSLPDSGNGKQKGLFIDTYQPFDIEWVCFEKVEDSTNNHSGYANGFRQFRSNKCKFYLPEKEEIIERNLVNGLLKKITGDPSFFYYKK